MKIATVLLLGAMLPCPAAFAQTLQARMTSTAHKGFDIHGQRAVIDATETLFIKHRARGYYRQKTFDGEGNLVGDVVICDDGRQNVRVSSYKETYTVRPPGSGLGLAWTKPDPDTPGVERKPYLGRPALFLQGVGFEAYVDEETGFPMLSVSERLGGVRHRREVTEFIVDGPID